MKEQEEQQQSEGGSQNESASNDKKTDTNSESGVFKPGDVIDKSYQIVKMIGRGGMGEVYRAKDVELDTDVALKVVSKSFSKNNSHALEMLRNEARRMASMRHQNIVSVMGFKHEAHTGASYIVMDYMDGGSLHAILSRLKERHEMVSEEQAIVIVQEIANALSYVSEFKIVHRDIKPDNILFTANGEVKLADLGIARHFDNVIGHISLGGSRGGGAGTPAYIAPEQISDPDKFDLRSDLYSLGVTFYEMLTGRLPFEESMPELKTQILFAEPPDPRTLNPNITEWCANLILRMLKKNPSDRFNTPKELIEAIDAGPHALSNTLLRQDLIRKLVGGECATVQTHKTLFHKTINTLDTIVSPQKTYKLLISVLGAVIVILSVALVVYKIKQPTQMPIVEPDGGPTVVVDGGDRTGENGGGALPEATVKGGDVPTNGGKENTNASQSQNNGTSASGESVGGASGQVSTNSGTVATVVVDGGNSKGENIGGAPSDGQISGGNVPVNGGSDSKDEAKQPKEVVVVPPVPTVSLEELKGKVNDVIAKTKESVVKIVNGANDAQTLAADSTKSLDDCEVEVEKLNLSDDAKNAWNETHKKDLDGIKEALKIALELKKKTDEGRTQVVEIVKGALDAQRIVADSTTALDQLAGDYKGLNLSDDAKKALSETFVATLDGMKKALAAALVINNGSAKAAAIGKVLEDDLNKCDKAFVEVNALIDKMKEAKKDCEAFASQEVDTAIVKVEGISTTIKERIVAIKDKKFKAFIEQADALNKDAKASALAYMDLVEKGERGQANARADMVSKDVDLLVAMRKTINFTLSEKDENEAKGRINSLERIAEEVKVANVIGVAYLDAKEKFSNRTKSCNSTELEEGKKAVSNYGNTIEQTLPKLTFLGEYAQRMSKDLKELVKSLEKREAEVRALKEIRDLNKNGRGPFKDLCDRYEELKSRNKPFHWIDKDFVEKSMDVLKKDRDMLEKAVEFCNVDVWKTTSEEFRELLELLDVLSSEDFALCSNINTMLQNQRSTVSFCKVLKEKLAECVEMPNVQSQHRDELRGQIKESLSKFRNNLKINKSRLGAGNKNVENRYNEISDALEVLGKRFGN